MKSKSKKLLGFCTRCGIVVEKSSAGLQKHFQDCVPPTSKEKSGKSTLLLVEGAYAPRYWMVVRVKNETAFRKIDSFLKDVWVECCGHMSGFNSGKSKIDKSLTVGDVMTGRTRVSYEYDFGTPTEITLSSLCVESVQEKKDIVILAKNIPIVFRCDTCEKEPAVVVCPFCLCEDEAVFCEECLPKHSCNGENGEESMLPLLDSPRVGQCGYTGPSESVKKYYPEGKIRNLKGWFKMQKWNSD